MMLRLRFPSARGGAGGSLPRHPRHAGAASRALRRSGWVDDARPRGAGVIPSGARRRLAVDDAAAGPAAAAGGAAAGAGAVRAAVASRAGTLAAALPQHPAPGLGVPLAAAALAAGLPAPRGQGVARAQRVRSPATARALQQRHQPRAIIGARLVVQVRGGERA
eukprot:scaffold1960_cov332-Prasinococcus_capsulatus_cf.AAC.1